MSKLLRNFLSMTILKISIERSVSIHGHKTTPASVTRSIVISDYITWLLNRVRKVSRVRMAGRMTVRENSRGKSRLMQYAITDNVE